MFSLRSPKFNLRIVTLVILVALILSMTPRMKAQEATFRESPMLVELVKAGKLPSVEQRLPKNPAVITPLVEEGKYGGNLRFGFVGENPGWGGMWYSTGWDNLVQWKSDFSGVQPNIAESWEVSPDATEYTFKLREGMKWSDGASFNADDIMFYIEDVLFNKDISKNGPVADWLPADGAEQFKATKVDEFTVKFKFAKPSGLLLYQLAQWNGRHITFFPKHYLSQFHKKYNEKIDDLVKEAGVDDWVSLFNQKAAGPTDDIQNFYKLVDRPLLYPWIVKQPLGSGTTIVLERNPYYYKVDTAGNQLPYIDMITGVSYQKDEARTLAMINGDLDYIKDPGDGNRAIYFDAVDQGKPIKISSQINDGGTTNTIQFNRNTEDPVKAKIFADKNFRIGMSYAINRSEIIDVVFGGQGEPSQAAPLKDSPLYNEKLATQYTEFSIDKANEYLDKVLPNKGSDGMRLGPDGKPFSIVFSVSNDLSYGSNWVQIAQLVIGYWKKVGVDVALNSMPDKEFATNRDQNKLEATMYTGEGGAGLTGILDPRYYVPGELFGMYGNGWFAWRMKSTTQTQIEPLQDIKDFRAMYDKVLTQPTTDAQIAEMKKVLDAAADAFWVIGISRPAPGYQPYSDRLGNQPDEWVAGWIEGVQKITFPEQWYLKQ
jgi:peptide/nickel transport system substrate-binding protein